MLKIDAGAVMKEVKAPPLERYVQLLETIGAAGDSLNLSEVAERTSLPVGTAHRLLQNLQRSGLVEMLGPTRKDYRLGERLLRLLHAGSDDAWLQIAVQPALDKLANELAETCYLTQLVGHQVMSIAWAVPTKGLQGYVVPGHVMPPHAAASAKAILAFQPKSIIDKALAGKLAKLAAKTLTTRAAVEREYASVREAGHATCFNEMEMGVGALAVPISIPDIGVIYSLGASGLIDRLTRRPQDDVIRSMNRVGNQLSRVLRDRVQDANGGRTFKR